jgi:hypothetical protein
LLPTGMLLCSTGAGCTKFMHTKLADKCMQDTSRSVGRRVSTFRRVASAGRPALSGE